MWKATRQARAKHESISGATRRNHWITASSWWTNDAFLYEAESISARTWRFVNHTTTSQWNKLVMPTICWISSDSLSSTVWNTNWSISNHWLRRSNLGWMPWGISILLYRCFDQSLNCSSLQNLHEFPGERLLCRARNQTHRQRSRPAITVTQTQGRHGQWIFAQCAALGPA